MPVSTRCHPAGPPREVSGDLPEAQMQAYQFDQPVNVGDFTVSTALAGEPRYTGQMV